MTKKQQAELQKKALEAYEQFKKREKKILKLAHHPDQIRQSIKDLKEWADTEDLKNLFADIELLVGWALDKLPIVPPPQKEGDADASPSTNGEKKSPQS